MSYVLAIDQGTTSTRAIVFNKYLQIVASSQKEIEQYFPFPGWVEHDLEEIYATVIATVRDAVKRSKISSQDILSIGITNQRETTAIWGAETGQAISKAIVWQDRRTSEFCDELKKNGGYIPGVRPGDPTAKFLDHIMTRLTMAGALSLTLIALFPDILLFSYNIPFNVALFFGGTGMLITVGVLLDTMRQLVNLATC